MNEHPILFSGPMVQAILEGRKTQTRRVLKPQPVYDELGNFWTHPKLDQAEGFIWFDEESMVLAILEDESVKCPYGYAYADGTGDVLWVRETWQAQTQSGAWWHEVKREDRGLLNWAWTNPIQPAYEAAPPRWMSGRFMPRAACRIFLEITNVRVERVQQIDNHESWKEGIPEYENWTEREGAARDEFARLWNKINASRGYGWDVNPWVWVIEFKPCTPPEMRLKK